jgi:hypothetical protein
MHDWQSPQERAHFVTSDAKTQRRLVESVAELVGVTKAGLPPRN